MLDSPVDPLTSGMPCCCSPSQSEIGGWAESSPQASSVVSEWYHIMSMRLIWPQIKGTYIDSTLPRVEAEIISQFFFFALLAVRPFGGMVLGHIADSLSRAAAVTVAAVSTVLSSVAMYFLPTFAQCGWLSTFLLAAIQVITGVAAGGQVRSY